MITEDQSQVIEFLGSPSTHGGAPVERAETHASIVFLAGDRAWKLKRAVRYDYLDFSTPERRKAMCEAEVRVNRRTAPPIYRGVTAVTRERDGSLALGGTGTPLDWLVEMTRFDQANLFDRLAAAGALELALMPAVASAVADLHKTANPRFDRGGASGIARVIDGNAAGFAHEGRGILDPARCEAVTASAHRTLAHHAEQLDERRRCGLVRECHGDLHLRNIVLLDGRPTLFDAIEFNDHIACIDVLFDLAFLLMDLWRRALPRHANAVLNAYLSETELGEGIGLLPLFLSCRAAIRAHTSAAAAALQADAKAVTNLHVTSREYLEAATELLEPPGACLVAVGGLSGSGKSRLALALAPSLGAVPGAVVLRSDVIRKRLLGVSPLTRLGADAYTEDVSQRVYAEIAERAGAVLREGHAVVADAVYARPQERDAIEEAAAAARAPFAGIWLEAPEPVRIERARTRGLDPSDADERVIRAQQARDPGPIDWRRIEGSATAEAVLHEAERIVEECLPACVNARGRGPAAPR